jgi:hypothetical protein
MHNTTRVKGEGGYSLSPSIPPSLQHVRREFLSRTRTLKTTTVAYIGGRFEKKQRRSKERNRETEPEGMEPFFREKSSSAAF